MACTASKCAAFTETAPRRLPPRLNARLEDTRAGTAASN